MVNILILNYEFPPVGGGGGAVSRDLAIMLKKKGHTVSVVTMRYGNLPAVEEKNGIMIYRVRCLRRDVGVCHPYEQLTYLLSAVWFCGKLVKEQKFDICHAHFIIPTGVASWYLKKRYHLPYIITAHGSDVEGYNQKRFIFLHKILRPFWEIIVRQAETVVAPSGFLKALMLKSDSRIRYTIIPNGIDLAYYKRLAEAQPKTKSMIVLCRLQETKGVQDVIRAFASIRHTGWKLNILGDGPYRAELEKIVRESHVSGSVIFHGWVKNKSREYEKLLGESYLYLSGSRFENCPMSVLEAAGAGCRLLISDIPAHRMLIEEKDIFFPCGSVKKLAERMAEMVGEYADVQQEKYDMDKYDWDRVCESYEKILKTDAGHRGKIG